MAAPRSKIGRLVTAALLLALAAVAAAPSADARSSSRVYQLGDGSTLTIKRGSVPKGTRLSIRRADRRSRPLGTGIKAVGPSVTFKVRGSRLRKGVKLSFKVPGHRALHRNGVPRFGVMRYRSKRWVPARTRLNRRRRTATVTTRTSARMALAIFDRGAAVTAALADWITRATGVRGPAADCSQRGRPPSWAEVETSNYEHDAIRSCGGAEGDLAVVEFTNNRPYGVFLTYGAPVEFGWSDGGVGITTLALNGIRVSDVVGSDGLYVPPTARASVGVRRGNWTSATFTAKTTPGTVVLDLIGRVAGFGKSYQLLGVLSDDCQANLLALTTTDFGGLTTRDLSGIAHVMSNVLPTVIDCSIPLAEAQNVGGFKLTLLRAAKALSVGVLAGQLAAQVVDRLGVLPQGASSFTVRKASAHSAPPSSQPQPTTPPTSSPGPSPQPQTWAEQQGSLGANTFTNPYNASGMGVKIQPYQWVAVSCKVYAPQIGSANPDGYWYRIASPPWSNAYYAVANTFWNGDVPGQKPYTHFTDWAVPNC